MFNIGIATFNQVFHDIFVTVSARQDQRSGAIGPSTDKLVDFMSRPVVQKDLQIKKKREKINQQFNKEETASLVPQGQQGQGLGGLAVAAVEGHPRIQYILHA